MNGPELKDRSRIHTAGNEFVVYRIQAMARAWLLEPTVACVNIDARAVIVYRALLTIGV